MIAEIALDVSYQCNYLTKSHWLGCFHTEFVAPYSFRIIYVIHPRGKNTDINRCCSHYSLIVFYCRLLLYCF